MVKYEILYNDELKNYTLEQKSGKTNSYKRVPIKYKEHDTTARFRKEQLKEEILNSNN